MYVAMPRTASPTRHPESSSFSAEHRRSSAPVNASASGAMKTGLAESILCGSLTMRRFWRVSVSGVAALPDRLHHQRDGNHRVTGATEGSGEAARTKTKVGDKPGLLVTDINRNQLNLIN